MVKGKLRRITYESKQTTGELILYRDGKELFKCKTLELPWRDNNFQVSCIPNGKYKVVPRWSQKFKSHFHILDVPKRDHILFHAGNYFKDILGCVLVGDSLRDINGDGFKDVLNSKTTLKRILELAPKGFQLEIYS